MEGTLYLFNPEHDLALASGEENYMAPATARLMATELALLPMWYAGTNPEEDSGSHYVLAPSAYNEAFRKEMLPLLGPLPALLTEPEVKEGSWSEIMPWGWDVALHKRLRTLGAPDRCLMNRNQIEKWKQLSHRSVAVALLPLLQQGDTYCGESFYLTTLEDVQQWVESHPRALLKAPLSGSGKGLNWCKGQFTSFIAGWAARILATQGGVVGEPVYDKVEDFAMEFFSDGSGNVCFCGYSLFHTNRSGMYQGNILASDDILLNRLTTRVPRESFLALQQRLESELSRLVGNQYRGYLGVDMMICRFFPDATETAIYRIHPCVEINLRMNMGVVARLLTDRYLAFCSTGIYQIEYTPQPGEALQSHLRMQENYPLHIQNKRVVSGYLPLVPVTRDSRYRAYLLGFDSPDITPLCNGSLSLP